jgi:chromosome segregation ATPase
MYLKELEINGFKSFGQKAGLSFSSSITSIVGPNGSGKSNVAEAFRFVLGEQSMKSMRGKRGEDLIFNGADSGSRSNRASVKVTFNNSTRFLSLDVDEVIIERIVFRDGSNEYYINGSKVRLKDILELLSAAHIGSTGHHIISQGEADRILNSNPKERKSIIEDALGLKTFQYKKQDSEKKLSKTEENIKEIELSRREIAPHIRFLKRQVEKIEQAMAMRIELGNSLNEYLKRENLYLQNEGSEVTGLLSEPLDKKKQMEIKLSEARDILSQSKKEDVKSQLFIDLDKQLGEVRVKKDSLVREIGRVEGEISSLETILSNEKKKLESESHKMIKLSGVSHLYEGMLQIFNKAEEESDMSIVKEYVSQVKERINNFIEDQKDEVDLSHLDDFAAQIENKIVEKNLKQNSIEEIIKEESEVSVKIAEIKKEIEEEKDSNRDAEKNVFQAMAELNHIETILAELNARKSRFELDQESFEEEIREGVALVGGDIADYKKYEIRLEDQRVSDEDILSENRPAQLDRRKKMERLKIRLEDAGGGNGDETVREYESVTERDQFLVRELEDLHKSSESLRGLVEDLNSRIEAEFSSGVKKINDEFSKFFAVMFGGGQAKLAVVKQEKRRKKTDEDSLDVPEEDEEEGENGVEISVSLPRKKIKSLISLSGGERALTSIALIFAMSQVNPPPFIILDETDAALDEANSRKYGDMVASLSDRSQLILITHNRETMSRAGVLYGVTMGSTGISKLLSIAFAEAVKVAK